jgi:hypothetical protein
MRVRPPRRRNHCAGPGDPSQLNCKTCGWTPGAHEDLGGWQDGEPMLVTESGQRFKVINERTINEP